MKLNIEVDLDWIDDEGNVDDQVKGHLIQGVHNAISKECLAKLSDGAKDQIEASIIEGKKTVEARVLQFVEDWLNEEKTISDAYGDPKFQGSLRDVVKAAFTNTLNKRVNDRGEFSDGRYGGTPMLEWIVNKRVKEVVEQKMKGLSKEMDASIEKLVKEGIKSRVSDKFAEMVIQVARDNHKQLPIETGS